GTIEITSNLIGVNAAGAAAIPNVGGISVAGNGHTIGNSGVGNVIAGNTQTGIGVLGQGHSIRGNYIGTNALDSAAIANGGAGIRVLGASNVTIGGTGAGEGNLISHNSYGGITLEDSSSNCTVLGNRVGTNAAVTAALGNSGVGISVSGSGHVI